MENTLIPIASVLQQAISVLRFSNPENLTESQRDSYARMLGDLMYSAGEARGRLAAIAGPERAFCLSVTRRRNDDV